MIRIAVIDDHSVVRAGLRAFLSEQPDLVVVAEASSGREAVDIVRAENVDVILLDISMPQLNGVDTLDAIRRRAPKLAVLVYSSFPEQYYALKMLRQGAAGYLCKDCDPDELVTAIRTVSHGRKYITEVTAELFAQELGKHPSQSLPHELLSGRELQVFLGLAGGETSPYIAQRLALSSKTVSQYRNQILEKLGLQTNSELTHYALTHGLIA